VERKNSTPIGNNLGGGGGKMKATKFGGLGVGMGGGLF